MELKSNSTSTIRSTERETLVEIVLVFLIVVIAHGYFYPLGDWNTRSRLAFVKAVVEENRFEIDSYHRSILPTEDEAYFNGHYYSDKAIGASLLGIEFYYPLLKIYKTLGWELDVIAFQQWITFLAIGLVTAFLAPLAFLFVKQVSGQAGFSLLVTLAICLGTPIYHYSTVFYGHVLAGLFLFGAFLIWFNMQNENKISSTKVLISGYFLGYAFITEYTIAIIAFLLGLYILHILSKRKSLLQASIYAWLGVGALLPLATAMLYNYAVFRNPFSTGYGYEASQQFSTFQTTGLMGIGIPNLKVLFYMTFHTTMGIFWQSPVLLMAFVGWFTLWQKGQPNYQGEGVLSLSVVLIYFVTLSGYLYPAWWGGQAFTPRLIIPALPFFTIPLAFLPRRLHPIFFFLMLISIIQIFFVVAAANYGLNAMTMDPSLSQDHFYSMFQNSTIYGVSFVNFLVQSMSPNLGQQLFGLRGFASLTPFLLVQALLLAIFFALNHQTSQPKSKNRTTVDDGIMERP